MVRARPAAVVAVGAGVVPEDWMDEQRDVLLVEIGFGPVTGIPSIMKPVPHEFHYPLCSSTNQWEEDIYVEELTKIIPARDPKQGGKRRRD